MLSNKEFKIGQTVWACSNTFEGLDEFCYHGPYPLDSGVRGWCALKKKGDKTYTYKFFENLYHSRLDALQAKVKWLKSNIKSHRLAIEKETEALHTTRDCLEDVEMDIYLINNPEPV